MRTIRTIAVVATVAACLLTTAHPVSAAVHDADIGGGVVTVYGTGSVPQDSYDLDPYVPHCPQGVVELDIPGNGTIGVTALDARSVAAYFGMQGSYARIVTRISTGSTYGTLSGSGPYTISDMRVGVQVVYAGSYEEGTCEQEGLAMCTITFVLELDGTLTTTTTGGVATLTGTGVGTVAEGPWCAGDFASLVGSTVAVSTPITATLRS